MSHSFHDLPAELFPLTLRAFNQAGEEVWAETVTGPGALYIPPLADEHGPVRIRIEYGDGTVVEP